MRSKAGYGMPLLSRFQKLLWGFTAFCTFAFGVLTYVIPQTPEIATNAQAPAFNAAFELTDHRGDVRSAEDFSGRLMLVFFGFTNCPDVCPTTLAEVAAIMNGLGSKADQVQPIFITIDPERDTPEVLAEYVPLFDDRIIGLTGTPKQVAATSKTFPIFFDRVSQASAPDGYTMAHTSHLFLFDREGGLAGTWPYGTPATEILKDLKARL